MRIRTLPAAALKQMDPEFESVAASLKQPFWRTFSRVSAPVCMPALSEIWIYLFVNAMTTMSAVVFLYSPSTTLASVAVLNMDDAGEIAPAAATGMMIFYTNAGVRIVHHCWPTDCLAGHRSGGLVNRVTERGRKRRAPTTLPGTSSRVMPPAHPTRDDDPRTR